jgi:polyketide synthase PksL
LHDWLSRHAITDAALADVAYTLQVGREALEERLATTVTTVAELGERLAAAAAGGVDAWRRGSVKTAKDAVAVFRADADAHGLLATWIAKGKYDRLLDLWVQGVAVDWDQLYTADQRPRRISLPTYPFAKERYWLESEVSAVDQMGIVVEPMHPLVHRNISTAFDLTFASRFTGAEWIFTHHLVNGRKMLPAAGHLEMARAAIASALDSVGPVRLRDVVWLRPLTVGDAPEAVEIRVQALNDAAVDYEIARANPAGEGEDDRDEVYSEGRGELVEDGERPSVDLVWLRGICTRVMLPRDVVYATFAASGLEYGPAHQGIVELRLGSDGADRPHVLATLELPPPMMATAGAFGVHPSVLDAAFQAAFGLVAGDGSGPREMPFVPFAAGDVTVYGPTPVRGYAWVRVSEGRHAGDAGVTLDVSVCDADGTVAVDVRELQARPVRGVRKDTSEIVVLHPQWAAAPAPAGVVSREAVHREVCLVGAIDAVDRRALVGECAGIPLHVITPPESELAAAYEAVALQVSEMVQTRMREGSAARGRLLQVVVLADEGTGAACYRGLSGLLKTATREQPRLLTQCIQVPAAIAAAELRAIVEAEACAPETAESRYRGPTREVRRWTETAPAVEGAPPWRDGGVYLLAGGAGGLGRIVAGAIVAATREVTLILTGRSALAAPVEAALAAWRARGARVAYHRVDVADRAAVTQVVGDVVATYGSLTGVIHAAGVLRDSFLVKKTAAEWQQVLAPKVAGLVHLDEATRELPLEHFICFGSATGVVGNPGQADYAAANAFMDAYAAYRQALVAQGRRSGQTLAIDWPLWADGGMRVDAATLAHLHARGLVPLETAAGLRVLHDAVRNAAAHSHVVVVAGDREKIRRGFPQPGRDGVSMAAMAVSPALEDPSGDTLQCDAVAYS